MNHSQHRAHSAKGLKLAVLSASTSRTLNEDKSGQAIVSMARDRSIKVVHHEVVKDDITLIRAAALKMISTHTPHAIVVTGGTGLARRDVTIEALKPMFDKSITGFGALFAQLSYQQVGTAALLSRADAGIVQGCLVFCLPGSLKACELACEQLIFKELGHMVHHVEKG